MFVITLSPFRDFAGLGPLSLAKSGSVLTINGDDLDLTGVLPGQTLPADAVTGLDWLRSDIVNIDGVFHLTLGFPHGPIPYPAPAEARAVTHPEPLIVSDDGLIDLPTFKVPKPTPEPDPVEVGDMMSVEEFALGSIEEPEPEGEPEA